MDDRRSNGVSWGLLRLDRRVKDLDDPTRYVIASAWTRKHVAFYDIEQAVYDVGEITPACLFRRRADAEAVALSLDRGTPRLGSRHRVVAVSKTPQRVWLLESLPDPFNSKKRIKPRLRARGAVRPPLLVPIAPSDPRGHIVEAFVFATEHREAANTAKPVTSDCCRWIGSWLDLTRRLEMPSFHHGNHSF